MPLPLVPILADLPAGRTARSSSCARAARHDRMFQASAIASALVLGLYAALALTLPKRTPIEHPIVIDIVRPPLESLPAPETGSDRPRTDPVAPPAPPAAEPSAGDEGIVVPAAEAPPEAPARPPAVPAPATGAGPAAEPFPGVGTAGPLPSIAPYYEEPPVPIEEHRPEYPSIAIDARVEGTVLLQVLVGADGRVEDVRVVQSIPLLDGAAADAVRRWVFRPALVSGHAVRVWVALPVKFSLH